MSLPDIAGIVFDMDGLLLDTERLYFAAFQRSMSALGLEQDDDLFRRMVGTNTTLGTRILTDGLAGRVTLHDFNAVWDADIAAQTAATIPVKPGVTVLAQHLREIGLPYIIATSTRTERAHHHLAKAGLVELFPDVVGGDMVTRSKPAPDIYLHAASVLGQPPHRLAAFEDSANGVRAAHAAGMVTVQVPDLVPPDPGLIALGHHIAADLIAGAWHLGLRL